MNGLPIKTDPRIPKGVVVLLHPPLLEDERHCHTEAELQRFRDLNCRTVTVISTAGEPSVPADPVAIALAKRRATRQSP